MYIHLIQGIIRGIRQHKDLETPPKGNGCENSRFHYDGKSFVSGMMFEKQKGGV